MTLAMSGHVALVTGGAGGLGRSISTALADAGATVLVGYRTSAEAAHALAAQLPGVAGQPHRAVECDVSDSDGLRELASRVAAEFGGLDVLVNCAGMTRYVAHRALDELDDELIDQIFTTNVRGAIASVRAFQSLLAQHGRGLVVNISSIAAQTAMGSNIAYCASKAAVDNLTKSLARALSPEIRVVSVSPGLVDTEFVRGLDEAWRAEQTARTPLQRLAMPDEVATAVVVLATQLTFTTGAVIPIDGGRPLG
ncbi:SDR family oxidoreductase [Paraburkholderia sp.]|uniref:SDR family NAD(P)-dependent oxidoreductase n=1 Tax=Paraburkholderia sp. TaxID=1926495 RepID=UPI002D5558D3|nr:SDR family oxidoreductase [Paraburkholderia sp.]HZZ02838.1 SDR family oxidoreductase [Paraburkholderia sp.]